MGVGEAFELACWDWGVEYLRPELVGPLIHSHFLTPTLLAEGPVLLSSPHAQVRKACFHIGRWRHSGSFEVNFTNKLKANKLH